MKVTEIREIAQSGRQATVTRKQVSAVAKTVKRSRTSKKGPSGQEVYRTAPKLHK